MLKKLNDKGKAVALCKKTKNPTQEISLISQYVETIDEKENRIFETLTTSNNNGNVHNRYTDSEAKMFEKIASGLGNKPNVVGMIYMYTERPACISCEGVAEQFSKRYKNIKVLLMNGNGNTSIFIGGVLEGQYKFGVTDKLLKTRLGIEKGIREKDALIREDFQ
jgi:hypothetical protein